MKREYLRQVRLVKKRKIRTVVEAYGKAWTPFLSPREAKREGIGETARTETSIVLLFLFLPSFAPPVFLSSEHIIHRADAITEDAVRNSPRVKWRLKYCRKL